MFIFFDVYYYNKSNLFLNLIEELILNKIDII